MEKYPVFMTPCGLFVNHASVCDDSTWYKGTEYSPENGNPTVLCPFIHKEERCEINSPVWEDYWEKCNKGTTAHICVLNPTSEKYEYSRSIEKQESLNYAERETAFDEVSKARNGHICYNQMKYDDKAGEWKDSFDPSQCVAHNCKECSLRGENNGNGRTYILYDAKVTYQVKGFGLIPDYVTKYIVRGIRLSQKTIREDLAKMLLKSHSLKATIASDWRKKHGFVTDPAVTSIEFTNFRAEKRASKRYDEDDDIMRRQGWRILYVTYDKSEKQRKEPNKNKGLHPSVESLFKQLSFFDI